MDADSRDMEETFDYSNLSDLVLGVSLVELPVRGYTCTIQDFENKFIYLKKADEPIPEELPVELEEPVEKKSCQKNW